MHSQQIQPLLPFYTDLPNLAGQINCDTYIEHELDMVDVRAKRVEKTRSEVPYTLIGELGPYTFTRAWRYWVVEGPVPLKLARAIYEHPHGKSDVRAAGNCTCPHPDTQVDLAGTTLLDQMRALLDEPSELESYMERAEPLQNEYNKQRDAALAAGDLDKLVVTSYHIDTMPGLKLFIKTVSQQESLAALTN